MTAYEKLTKCYECVKSKINFEPKVARVLGSGLGDYANSIDVKYTLSYKDIEGFPTSTVEGHKGQFVFGYVGDATGHPFHFQCGLDAPQHVEP